MKFLIDAQLPKGLCVGLARRGHEAIHVATSPGGEAGDEVIARFALLEGRIIITKDRDFPDQFARPGLHIVWLRVGNVTNSNLIRWLEARWDKVEQDLANGSEFIEVI